MPSVPRTRYGKSPWLAALPRARRRAFPRFRGEAAAPVVVIGGGLTGCAAAYGLAAAGFRVVLLEAGRLGEGGTGHAAGLMSGDAAPSYRAFERRHGRRAARVWFGGARRAVRDLAATARRLRMPGVHVQEALYVARTREEEAALRREARARREAGFEAPWLGPAAIAREAGLEEALGAFRSRGWGHADPLRLTLRFAAAAAARGAAIHEGSVVRRLRPARRHIDVVLAGGTIRAGTAVVCTGTPTPLHRPLMRHFRDVERFVVMTERVPASMRRAFGRRPALVGDGPVPLRVWWAGDRLLVAGADAPRAPEAGRLKRLVQRTGQLMYELLRLYPVIAGLRPAFGWSVPVARTTDGAPIVGPHRGFPRQLFAWGGAHDPAHALLASRLIVRHVRGEAEAADRFFSFTRR